MKHTQGTWTMKPVETVDNEFGSWPFAIESARCTIAGVSGIGTEAEANARLIATSPEMYDMLKAAIARVELANQEGNPILSAWLQDAKYVIDKAEGRE